ncbi:MAG: matrixin family metalloprotease [Muribaculaceae bacterium]|nr:matrixin family metalloprotease [Muribaculaceae bacterium]
MKKITVIFCSILILFGVTLGVQAIEQNHRWLYPKQLKVYVPPNHKRTIMMKHAFAEWTRLTSEKMVFKYVTSPNYAKIEVYFVDKIPNADREIGLTRFRYTSSGKMVSAQIYIADKTADGRALGKDSVYTVMLHEIGHAIGISQHSSNPLSIMFPYENDAQEILKSDLKTLAEIYGW